MEIRGEVTLEERKTIMLNLLEILMDYCCKHNLRVYLCGGTLLGAVRHGGFIPWDDDLDVIMPMEDYDKLMELAETDKLPEPYHFSTPKNNPYHIFPYIKMIDHRTVLVEDVITRRHRKHQEAYFGVYIDIFPMYGLPETKADRLKFQQEMCVTYRKLKKATRVMNRRPTDSWFVYMIRRILYFIYCIPNKLMGHRYYLRKLDKLKHRYPLDKAEKFGSATGITTGEKDHNDTSAMKETAFLKFENLNCPVLPSYHTMLKNQYGDYMKLPPEDQRHTHMSRVFWRKPL